MSHQKKGKAVYILFSLLLFLFLASYLLGRFGLFKQERLPLTSKKIAVIYVEGVLTDSRSVLQELEQYKSRKDVKALVFRIESPGGAVGSAQEIYEEIKKLSAKKTILASLGNVAASGGYYIACAAEEIVANPGTITGSIGVISEYPNVQELMKKIGWKTEILKSGRYKDVGNPMRDMTEDEASLMQSLLDNIHSQFIRDVAQGRKKEIHEIEPWADGRVFTGEQAQEIGLVDRLGNLQEPLGNTIDEFGFCHVTSFLKLKACHCKDTWDPSVGRCH